MRICPPVDTTIFKRRSAAPVGAGQAEVSPALVPKQILLKGTASVTLPSPLKVAVDWSAATTMLEVAPSAPERLCMVAGQSAFGVAQPTVQLEVAPSTNCTGVLRRTASARAS